MNYAIFLEPELKHYNDGIINETLIAKPKIATLMATTYPRNSG